MFPQGYFAAGYFTRSYFPSGPADTLTAVVGVPTFATAGVYAPGFTAGGGV